MKWKNTNLKTRLYLISAIILLLGFGSAILIYLTDETDSDNVLDYENSRMYRHDLELFGGKANVIMSDFRHWFAGLWHGESLAFTIAGITVFISFGFFFVANHLKPDLKSDARGENNRSGTG
jgi:hypothetical protein